GQPGEPGPRISEVVSAEGGDFEVGRSVEDGGLKNERTRDGSSGFRRADDGDRAPCLEMQRDWCRGDETGSIDERPNIGGGTGRVDAKRWCPRVRTASQAHGVGVAGSAASLPTRWIGFGSARTGGGEPNGDRGGEESIVEFTSVLFASLEETCLELLEFVSAAPVVA